MKRAPKKEKHKAIRLKTNFVGLVFMFFFFTVVTRSYQLQIQGSDKLNSLAKSQYKTQLMVRPKRGAIYDRNGDVLALDIPMASIAIHPSQIEDKSKVRKALIKHTSLNSKEIDQKLNSKKKFLWVERRIPKKDGDAIDQKRFKGVQVIKEYRRFYPNKELAGQVLGAVGYDAKALGGVELAYDDYLKSDFTKKAVERDARGKYFTPAEDNDSNHDLYLTIDRNIQHFTEEALTEYGEKHKVKSGFAIVADVQTGEVLALANYPRFNPNRYWKYPQEVWKNRAINDVFEPGSTFKTMLIGAALQSGKVKANDKFFCEHGKYRIGQNVINDTHGHGWIDTGKILQVSSNIGVTKIAEKIGRKTYYDFLQDMEFGKETKLGLIGEVSGSLRNYKGWRDIEFSNISFGQGVSVNGMQMVKAYIPFANGGNLLKTYVIKEIVNADNETVHQNKTKVLRKVLSEENQKSIAQMLHSVTQTGGTALKAHVDGYLSGGKTGTAQKFDHKMKAYTQDDYVSSFIGFAPLNNPRLAIYVVYDTPSQNGYYGGTVAGPVFRSVAEKTLKYYGVAPDLKNLKGTSYASDESKKKTLKSENSKDGSDAIASENISSVEMSLIHTKRLEEIRSSLQEKIVPDFRGLSLRSVLDVLSSYEFQYQIQGSGVVTTQYPKPGGRLDKVNSWKLELSHRS